MIMLYVILIEKGLRTIDQVPQNIRDQVNEIYLERNNLQGGI